MPALCRLRFLGPLQVERDGKFVRGFESQSPRAAGLSRRRQPTLRAQFHCEFVLAGQIGNARARNLSPVLHNLSALLPGVLTTDRDTIRLQRIDGWWLDTPAFEELIAAMFEGLAGLAYVEGKMECAACLYGAANKLQEMVGESHRPFDLVKHDRNLAASRASFGEAAFAALWAQGSAMSLAEAIQCALRQS